jgi:DNA-binding CsgD family transcriptional regulator
MERAEQRLEPDKARVLLFTRDQPAGRSYVAALEKATVQVEWVKTAAALRSRMERSDLPRPTVVMVLPSRQRSLPPTELARVVLRLTMMNTRGDVGTQGGTASPLVDSLNDYCAMRSLSGRQRQVLEAYLIGNNDKEIASTFNCSATTVYEHWRRMARKASGQHKSDVVNDFHRFLAATRPEAVSQSLPTVLAAPERSRPRPEAVSQSLPTVLAAPERSRPRSRP